MFTANRAPRPNFANRNLSILRIMEETKKVKKGAPAARLVSKGNGAQGWHITCLLDQIHQFNVYALPVLRDLGAFDTDISNLLDMSKTHLYALFLTSELKKAKNDVQREQIRQEAPAKFAEYYAEKSEGLTRINTAFSPKALACIHYNPKWGEFSLDREAYLKDTYIMAETPKELAALDALEAITAALNSFDWKKVQFRNVFKLDGSTLTRPYGTGKFVIREDLPRELWDELLKTYKG